MMNWKRAVFALGLVAVTGASGVGLFGVAMAQQEEAERSRFIRFVESQISTPDRQIRLNGIQGTLSSDVTISSITIADREGVWLTIENAHLVWSRLALLRGRLDVDLLEADRIVLERSPTAPEVEGEEEAPEEAGEFEIPELPVAVEMDALAIPRVEIGEAVFGEAAELGVEGAFQLADGSLEAQLAIERLDSGGSLALDAAFDNESRQLDLDLSLSEPADGVVANALNLEGRPALTFTIAGSGPLDEFAADISLVADEDELLAGTTTISSAEGGLRFVADVEGALQRIVPAPYDVYFNEGSRLALDATRAGNGAISIPRLELTSGVVAVTGNAEIAEDGFPTLVDFEARLENENGDRVPLPGGGASVQSGLIEASLGGDAGEAWQARFDLDELRTEAVSAQSALIEAGGVAADMNDPEARRVTFDVTGRINGLDSDDEDIAEALGETGELSASGSWSAGEPVSVPSFRVAGANAEASFEGAVDEGALDGAYSLAAGDLAVFSGLAGRDLAGALDLGANGVVALDGSRIDLDLDGTAVDLEAGIEAVAEMLAGETRLSGGLTRGEEEGFGFEGLTVENAAARIRLDGRYGGAEADLTAEAQIAEIGRLTERASGAVALEARLRGPADAIAIGAAIAGPDLTVMDRPLRDALIRFDGTLVGSDVNGDVEVSGDLDNVPIDLETRVVTLEDGGRVLEGLAFSAGETVADGNLLLRADGLMAGDLTFDSPDIAEIAPLLLAEASGALSGDISLAVEDDGQAADIAVTAQDLVYETISIQSAEIDLAGADLMSAPILSGDIAARRLAFGETVIEEIVAQARRSGTVTDFEARAELAQGTLETAGALEPIADGLDVTLERLALDSDIADASLADPVTISLREGTIEVPGAALDIGSGRILVDGRVAERIDLTAEIDALPLSIANAVLPDLEMQGEVSGSLAASGARDNPSATFDLAGSGIQAAPLRQAGIDALALDAEGTYTDGTLDLDASTNIGGGEVTVSGTLGETLDIDGRIDGLPLSLANAFAPDLGLAGSASATFQATGSPTDPRVAFDADIAGLGAAPLRQAGIGALSVAAEGVFENETVRLAAVNVDGSGIALRGSGDVPIDGEGLALDLSGSAPLTLSDAFLAGRGARLTGTLTFDVGVRGSFADPSLTGSLAADNARFVDGQAGIVLDAITLRASLNGDSVSIEPLSARLGDGTVSVSGSLGIDPATGFPADLVIALRQARYEDARLVTATVSGDLTLTGPLLENAVLGGTVRIERAEVTIPEALPGGGRALDVEHRGASPAVLATLRRAGLLGDETDGDDDGGGPSPFSLNVVVEAPNQIFVRGRGLDAELGGQLALNGPISDIRPVGSFELRRGRIDILGQRITFDRGEVTLIGDLDPYLDFAATTQGQSITVTATVTGTASDPEIGFTSTPELPQDEVLSQLLFGRSIDDLSPLQLARLAAAAAQLAGGGGGGGLFDQIRSSAGLDNLDLVTDEEGNTAVEAGRYVSENVYLGVRAGEETSGVTINLDITENLKARGEAGQNDSGLGIFYEREY